MRFALVFVVVLSHMSRRLSTPQSQRHVAKMLQWSHLTTVSFLRLAGLCCHFRTMADCKILVKSRQMNIWILPLMVKSGEYRCRRCHTSILSPKCLRQLWECDDNLILHKLRTSHYEFVPDTDEQYYCRCNNTCASLLRSLHGVNQLLADNSTQIDTV